MTIHDTNFGNAALEPQVFIRGGAVFATSRDVAEFFEKRHKNVLRDIERLIELQPSLGCGLNFEPTSGSDHILNSEPTSGSDHILNSEHMVGGNHFLKFEEMVIEVAIGSGATRPTRAYAMDRDAFALLAMGFTGDKALEFKIRYIKAFRLMEAELRAQSEDRARRLEEMPPESGPYWLGLVREARRTFGKVAARQVWAQSPLPEVTMPARADWSDLDTQISDYLSEKCVMTGNRSDFLRSRVLLQGFEDYCIERGIDAPGRRTLSNALRRVADVYRDPDTGRGMAPMKRSDVGYAGVVLR